MYATHHITKNHPSLSMIKPPNKKGLDNKTLSWKKKRGRFRPSYTLMNSDRTKNKSRQLRQGDSDPIKIRWQHRGTRVRSNLSFTSTRTRWTSSKKARSHWMYGNIFAFSRLATSEFLPTAAAAAGTPPDTGWFAWMSGAPAAGGGDRAVWARSRRSRPLRWLTSGSCVTASPLFCRRRRRWACSDYGMS